MIKGSGQKDAATAKTWQGDVSMLMFNYMLPLTCTIHVRCVYGWNA